MANTRQRWEKGAILYYEAPYRNRIVDAFGKNVTKQIPNWGAAGFVTATSTLSMPYVATITEAGGGETTIAPQGDGTLLITTDAAEYDGANIQMVGSPFKLYAGSPLYCGARLKISEATQSDFVFGLCSEDTALMAVAGAHATDVAYGIYFSKLDAVTAVYFNTEENTTETNVAASTLDTSWHWYEFFSEGATTVKAYVDGVYVGASTTNLPTTALTLSFNFRTGSTNARTCYIDGAYAVQLCPKA
jgi:hypothetical protein